MDDEEPLPPCAMLRRDHWLCIAGNLGVRDLCHLMQVSPTLFTTLVCDSAWFRHRKRVCARFPQLEALFNIKVNKKKKKRKTVSIIPQSGTWWIFSRWLALGCDMIGFRKAMKDESMHPLMDAILRNCLSKPEHWMTAYVDQIRTKKRWFIIAMRCKPYWSHALQFHVAPVHRLMKATIVTTHGFETQSIMRERDMYYTNIEGVATITDPLSLPELYFKAWTAFLCDLPNEVALRCTHRFANFAGTE